MIFTIRQLLDEQTVAELRAELKPEVFSDGAGTASGLAKKAKNNLQLTINHPTGKALAAKVSKALRGQQQFQQMVLPVRMSPPMFNLYQTGMRYGQHSDSALMQSTEGLFRADLSMTVFLSDPAEYDGGELFIKDPLTGTHKVKLAAGSALFYPTLALHEVLEVTRGERFACILWLQSAIRDPLQRGVLHQIARAKQHIQGGQVEAGLVELAQVTTNLQRFWAET